MDVNVFHAGWDSEYQNWSCGEAASSWTKNTDTNVGHPDLVVDGSDVWNEVTIHTFTLLVALSFFVSLMH